ncbi:hypothetical protein DOY81_004265 [Sarcophaga bullata]|nr:hypothetical protein DOY81_004265 [Sarcophaga bullata]
MVIQRGWKILSDTGSTSASSTEANRSPMGGLNSSSDDSNCSNQTTHSMVTSVASPPNSSAKIETTSITANTSTNSHHHQQTNETTMKFITTPQMAENTLQKLRQRYSNTTPLTSSSAESAMRSLELVRIAVQSAFDKEIDEMVKHFIETYFKPAFNNIKENLGQGAINEDALQKMSCALLENAKSQYKILRFKPQIAINSSTSTSISNISENNAVRMTLKRPVPNKPTSSVFEMQKRFLPDNMVIKSTAIQQTMPQQHLQSQQQQQIAQVLPTMATIEANVSQNQNTTAFVQQQQQQQLPQQTTTTNLITVQSQQPQTHPRRQIFWNTGHISTNTKFVLDVQANQAFGFGTEGKERLASKHPELIRYLPDNEDRDWLINQQIIPQQNRNSRFLFLIYDEVCRLYQTHENYKNKSTIDLSVMMTFTVPEFMIQKMKVFFVDLNIKSRGLITNSYSMAGATTATIHQQMPQQQQQQQIQNQQQQQQQSNSHLRNALLLGTQQSLGATSNATASANITSDSTTSATSSSASSTSSSNITSTETILQQKTKSSNLSSSHATLTALLNNSSTASSTSTSTNTSVLNDKSNSSTNLSALSLSTPTLLNKLRK